MHSGSPGRDVLAVDALKEMLKKAQIHGCLARGIHEAYNDLESCKSRLRCLTENVDEDSYQDRACALRKAQCLARDGVGGQMELVSSVTKKL